MRKHSLWLVILLVLSMCVGCSPKDVPTESEADTAQTWKTPPEATSVAPTTAPQSVPVPVTEPEPDIPATPHPLEQYLDRKLTDREMAQALVGHWHASPDTSSGYANRFVFWEDGSYAFFPNEMDIQSRFRAHTGTYSVENGWLKLYATHQVVLMDGMIVDATASTTTRYKLVDYNSQVVSFAEPCKMTLNIWQKEIVLDFAYDEESDCTGVKVSIDHKDYWLFKPFADIPSPPVWEADLTAVPEYIESMPDSLYERLWRPWKPIDIPYEDELPVYSPYGIGSFFSEASMFGYEDADTQEVYYGYSEDHWGGCSMWCGTLEWETATASSCLESIHSTSFSAENINTGHKDVTWCEGSEGYGVGEWIEIAHTPASATEAEWHDNYESYTLTPIEPPLFIPYTGFCIVNGYAKSEALWQQNSRARRLKLYVNGEAYAWLDLADTMKPQYFSLDGLSAQTTTETVFRFEIAQVYPGDMYDDTCITGIEIGFPGFGH